MRLLKNCSVKEVASFPPKGEDPVSIAVIYTDRLHLIYSIDPQDDANLFAVIAFKGAIHHTVGWPNDEALAGHPLFKFGLMNYAAHIVENSPDLALLREKNELGTGLASSYFEKLNHWIFTFPDCTVEVFAEDANLVGTIESLHLNDALLQLLYGSSSVGELAAQSRDSA